MFPRVYRKQVEENTHKLREKELFCSLFFYMEGKPVKMPRILKKLGYFPIYQGYVENMQGRRPGTRNTLCSAVAGDRSCFFCS